MSVHKKKPISYTIPANSDDDDDEDDEDNHRVRARSRKERGKANSSHMNPMIQMNSMMNSMFADPFGMLEGFGGAGRRSRGGGRELMPFGFPNMNDIFQNIQMNMNDPNCHTFSSSTVMTMSSGPDGRPQVYRASQSTRTAPGGIRETTKAVSDSVSGTKKLAIGHHIGERSHIKEREQNLHSGQVEEREDFINLEEDEAEDFNQEWERKTRSGLNAIGYDRNRIRGRRQREDIPAILDRYRPHYYPRSRITSRRSYPAITSSSSSQVEAEAEATTPEKGKKRKEEDDKSTDEESYSKKSKVLKSSRKKKH